MNCHDLSGKTVQCDPESIPGPSAGDNTTEVSLAPTSSPTGDETTKPHFNLTQSSLASRMEIPPMPDDGVHCLFAPVSEAIRGQSWLQVV